MENTNQPDEPRCETCRFWVRLEEYIPSWQDTPCSNHGECRRYPGGGEPMMFPLSEIGQWCGEHQPRIPLPVVENNPILDKSVHELGLQLRARIGVRQVLLDKGIDQLTVGELIKLTKEDLMEVRNFGSHSLINVRQALAKLGLKLRGD